MNELCGNVYENKGPLWKTRWQSGNVYENTGTYPSKAGMLLKTQIVSRWRVGKSWGLRRCFVAPKAGLLSMAGAGDARCSHLRLRVRVEISGTIPKLGHDWAQFPTFRTWRCCKCHIIELGDTRFGICLLSLQNDQGLRLRNATQTNPSLTIGWQKNCSPEHAWV